MNRERRASARLKLVDEHIALENQHDLEGILRTFGTTVRYDDEPWEDHFIGRDKVRDYYTSLLTAMPDLHIEVRQRYASEDAVVVEVTISGHHLGAWRGLPPTGRPVCFPLCGIFVFDDDDRLAGERTYYDRDTVLRQLGDGLTADVENDITGLHAVLRRRSVRIDSRDGDTLIASAADLVCRSQRQAEAGVLPVGSLRYSLAAFA